MEPRATRAPLNSGAYLHSLSVRDGAIHARDLSREALLRYAGLLLGSLLSGSIAASLLVMLEIGCNTVDPSECWPNTSGGFGGAETIPKGCE